MAARYPARLRAADSARRRAEARLRLIATTEREIRDRQRSKGFVGGPKFRRALEVGHRALRLAEFDEHSAEPLVRVNEIGTDRECALQKRSALSRTPRV